MKLNETQKKHVQLFLKGHGFTGLIAAYQKKALLADFEKHDLTDMRIAIANRERVFFKQMEATERVKFSNERQKKEAEKESNDQPAS